MDKMYDWRTQIDRHDYVIDGALTHPFESIHLGSGEIGASVNIYPHEIKIVLGKADVWDVRLDSDPEADVFTQDELIQMMREKDRDLQCSWGHGPENKLDYYNSKMASYFRRPPNPKRAGCIRLYHPGLSNTKVSTRVRLAEGVLETTFVFPDGKLIVNAFAERGENRFWVRAQAEGEIPWFALIVEKEPDDSDNTLPLPVIREHSSNMTTISQTIPGGFGIDEFTWHLAAAFPKSGDGVEAAYVEHHYAWRVRQYCALQPGASTALCVALASTRDGTGDARERALALAKPDMPFEALYAKHKEAWAAFWDTSSIALDDEEMESVWYRNHFGYGCALRPGMMTLGSGGNVVIQDVIPWHGTCHMNHNFQKWYCTALPTNHAEWIDLYANFIENTMPIFEKQAQLIFGLEGVYCDLMYMPVMTTQSFDISNFMGRALALTGWAGQPLWWHWAYTRDKDWLRKRGYTYLKKAAQFYYNYMEKYSDETGEIYPSIRLEEPEGFKKGFVGNRNVVTDLCMFKKAFDWAIDAAQALDVDHEWQAKWQAARDKVPAIGHGIDEDGDGWIALDKHWPDTEPKHRADFARHSRWGGGGWIVFPGEYMDGDGDDSLTLAMRAMLSRIDLQKPFVSDITGKNLYPGVPIIHPISSIVPSIRLGLTAHFNAIREILLAHRLTYGQFCSYRLSTGKMPPEVMGNSGYLWYDWRSVENKYIGVLAITEMLLQSQGGVIRLFPLWPTDRDAAFDRFRAIGGFIVSASKKGGEIQAVVESLSGERARIKCPGTNAHITCEGREVPVRYENNAAVFDTEAGKSYVYVENR